jgi:subtilase-type serine protease
VSALADADVAGALTQLGGTPYATQARLAALNGQRATRLVADRLGDVRDVSATAEAPHAIAVTSSRTTAPPSAVWFRSNDQASTLDGSSTGGRLDGGLLGVDHRFDSGWLVGAFGGLDRGRLQANDGASTLTDRRYRGGAYVSRSSEQAYVDAVLGLARHTYEASRHIAFAAQLDAAFGGGPLLGGVNRTAASRVNGWETSGLVEAGLRRAIATMKVQPFVALDWTRVGREAFTEAGADAIALTAAAAATQSVRAGVGVRLSHRVGSAHRWTPRGELRYARELENASTSFTTAFVDAAATRFTIHSATLGRDAAIGSVGIVAAVGARLVMSADYQATFETNHHVHAMLLGLAF